MKKILFSLFWIITLWLINFSSATNYTCSDTTITITEDSYLILNKFIWRSFLEIWDINNSFCYSISFSRDWLGYWTDCDVPSSFPIILTPWTYYVNCSYSTSSFSVVPVISSCPTCDYSDYELKSDITENYCKNKFSSLMTSSECDSLYSWYVSPTLYQNCTNSLNSCSWELWVCNSSLNSCLNWNYTWNVQWSSIWINNIQHLWNKNIYIDIPEEISWDYLYTWDNMLIGVEWYNVDAEYIRSVINKQNYIPTTEDFSNVFSNFGLFGWLLVVCLFVIFVFYIIKKIFS